VDYSLCAAVVATLPNSLPLRGPRVLSVIICFNPCTGVTVPRCLTIDFSNKNQRIKVAAPIEE
jgi:hypothetical protein